MSTPAPFDPDAPLRFIINAGSGSSDEAEKREVIERALQAAGRRGELQSANGAQLPGLAREAAKQARAERGAVIAVGGDGTLNAVAQAAIDHGCVMGVVARGTFNFFARTHGLPTDPPAAMAALLQSTPQPVQVGLVNDTVFLVNASLGLYPALLEDREAFKQRFGRTRVVAVLSALATLWREHRQLHLRIDGGGGARDVRTPTLFVGNNRLQLEKVGLREPHAGPTGTMAAVMLKPVGTAALLWLLVRGAFGELGGADDIETFDFERIVVSTGGRRARRVKVAVDGEVGYQQTPIEFKVSPTPLYLLQPPPHLRVVEEVT